MKQGKASSNVRSGQHRDPISHVVNPRAVAQIGAALGNKVTGGTANNAAEELYAGRGFKAPLKSVRTRTGGSQGSY